MDDEGADCEDVGIAYVELLQVCYMLSLFYNKFSWIELQQNRQFSLVD